MELSASVQSNIVDQPRLPYGRAERANCDVLGGGSSEIRPKCCTARRMRCSNPPAAHCIRLSPTKRCVVERDGAARIFPG